MQFTYNYQKISSKWYLIYSITEQKRDPNTEQQIVCALLDLGRQLPFPVGRAVWGWNQAQIPAELPRLLSLELSNVSAVEWAWGHGCKSKNKKSQKDNLKKRVLSKSRTPSKIFFTKVHHNNDTAYPCFGSRHTWRLVLTVTTSFSQEGNFPIILLRNDTMVSP